ncbi:hypothetical protein BC830DRAFT_1127222 [Chytriomyces sp. MP71]|nr:hypothetical protein BC830DRAFT_1127222 [Chytriomyces sp. MP71]
MSKPSPPSLLTTPYLANATKLVCWKCNGAGVKKLRAPRPDSKGKKILATVPCAICVSTGTSAAAALNDTTKPLPPRVVRRGLVRAFKPPPNWECPGPAPSLSISEAGINMLREGEMLTSLCGSWSIFQLLQGHRYTTDDLSTAAIAIQEYSVRKLPLPKRHIDIGCGLGSVLLFCRWYFSESLQQSLGVEAQEKHVELARKSILVNMGERESASHLVSEVRYGDLRDLGADPTSILLEHEVNVFDLVTGTPPYFPISNGTVPTVQGRGMCSFELRGGVETYCLAARQCLTRTSTARFVFVQTAIEVQRSEDAIWNLAQMRILERVDFYGVEGKEGALFVIFVCGWDKGGEDFALPVKTRQEYDVRRVVVRTRDGKYTNEYHELLVLVGKPPLQ